MFQQILLAWDGSELALRAFDIAIDLARRYDAELLAVSIAYSPAHAETTADRGESSNAAHRYLQDTFRQVSDRAERAGIVVEHHIVDGETPARALADYAHERGSDVIVCGHHHSRRAGRLLLRGVTEHLLSATTTPLLIVSDDTR